MKFESEIELVKVLKATLELNYSRANISIFEEVSVGYGIADLVLCVLDYDNSVKPQGDREALNQRDINIYNLIDRVCEINLLEIVEITRISKTNILQSLRKLKLLNLVDCVHNYYFVSNKYCLTSSVNFAIEAKLKDWKRALLQAYRYKWFAEYSFVVLDEHTSKGAYKNLNLFKKYNVGLATINLNGELKRLYTPTQDVPFDSRMQILLSEQIIQFSAIC